MIAPTTYADLDAANLASGHYTRRPRYLLDAIDATEQAWAEYDALIDAEAGRDALAAAERIWRQAEAVERVARARWEDEQARRVRQATEREESAARAELEANRRRMPVVMRELMQVRNGGW